MDCVAKKMSKAYAKGSLSSMKRDAISLTTVY